jgi:hypothetical protein
MQKIFRFFRGRAKLKRKAMGFMNHHDHQTASHEGIKTVGVVDKLCDFSSNSDLCICIVTWNMNGQVRRRSSTTSLTRINVSVMFL